MKSSLNQYFEEALLSPITKLAQEKPKIQHQVVRKKSNKITLSQYFEKELLEETTADECIQATTDNNINNNDEEVEEGEDIYTSYASYMSSSNPGSDNLLVTFDYGSHNSLEFEDLSLNSQQHEFTANDEDNKLFNQLFKIPEETSFNDFLLAAKNNQTHSKSSNNFAFHQIQHDMNDSNNNTRTNSCITMASSLVECNIDTSGDYGSWAQTESEQEEQDSNYRYENLIKNEVLIYDDDDDDVDGNNVNNSNEARQALINFNFNENIPPLWFNNNEQLYYKSLDYLN